MPFVKNSKIKITKTTKKAYNIISIIIIILLSEECV
jgi:hypothetical protein